jgi:hypothetical protein
MLLFCILRALQTKTGDFLLQQGYLCVSMLYMSAFSFDEKERVKPFFHFVPKIIREV